jgi:DNA-binding response OmpR family regulator
MMMRKKVMLVDDSSTVLMLHRMMLKDDPYELVIARDGQEAVEKAAAERPDIIFLDVVMPRMDGIAACTAMRQAEATRQTPILMVTTRGEPQHVEAGYAAGCTEYITKPFNGAELRARLKHYLGE